MRKIPISIATLCMLVLGLAVPLSAQPAPDRGPCEQITAACQGAGFTPGGARTGTGLQADCIVPIMQGEPQPRQARNPLPQVDPQLVADCKASNPRFGRGNAPPSAAPAQASPASPPPCASSDDTIPSGLAVVLPSGRYHSLNLQALNNVFMSGVAVQINWRDIEPVQGKPDWSKLDELFAAAESSKKWVQLAIFPGFFSPAWALDGAKTDLFAIPYGPGHGTVARLPMPWDRVYLDRWLAFVKQLSERYARSPAFRMIAAAGPTSVSEEMTLPVSPPAIRKWLDDSYTPAKYLGAWQTVFQVYADSFANQCVSLAGPGLPILAQGRIIDRPAHLRARQEIVDRALRVFRHRLAIQSNDLHAGHAAVEAPDYTDFINSYSGRIITGFEMRGGSRGPIPSKIMGAEGNPPLALRRSIDKGMAANDAGRHVNYLQIYEGDVLAADMQPVLQYAASLFRRSHP